MGRFENLLNHFFDFSCCKAKTTNKIFCWLKLIKKHFFSAFRSSTSKTIRVYDYFGWFAWSLNTEHQPGHVRAFCACVRYSTSPLDLWRKSSSRSGKVLLVFHFFILKTEKKALRRSEIVACLGVELCVATRSWMKKSQHQEATSNCLLGIFSFFLFFCCVLVSVWCQTTCVITFMENTHFPFYLVFSRRRSLAVSAWGFLVSPRKILKFQLTLWQICIN